jgi:hypothetical protein
MGFFDDHRGDPTRELSQEQIPYLRRVLTVHTNHPATGGCPVCAVRCCADWRDAFDGLAIAGQPMAEPDCWRPPEQGSPV